MPRRLIAPLLVFVSVLASGCALRAPGEGAVLAHGGSRVRLTLPAAWPSDAYVAHARRGASAGHPGSESTLSAEYVPLAPGLPRTALFQLVVYPSDREPTGPGDVLAEAASRIYVLVIPREQPYPEGSADAARLVAMRPTLAEIRKGLVITSGED